MTKSFPLLFVTLMVLVQSCTFSTTQQKKRPEAGRAMASWAMARMYPDGKMHSDRYARAFEQAKNMANGRNIMGEWEALGPKNIGGRTLCMALHPLDSNIIFLGAASGGIWKTTTAGRGTSAWERIETGFPVLGVSAIAIDPSDPNIMYIGTGEVYNYENSMPNIAFRTTRGTYGIGILKTTDGGITWQKSLDFSYQDLEGVQEIRINPLRPQTVYATTTSGVMRSYNSGATWTRVIEKKMAVDLEIHPADTNQIFVTFGSLEDNPESGIFRSLDAGNTFVQITDGLPDNYSGKALLTFAPSNPDIIYVSVGEAFAQNGLYQSTDGGNSFNTVSTVDVSKYQGWYSHDVAVKPDDPDYLVWVGIDTWLSADAGTTVTRVTNWYDWFFGQVPVGGPEGPGSYVHADIHHVYFHPTDHHKVYAVTDGGFFVSHNGGSTWEGRNGGYQTQQFYANFSNSTYNPDIAIGGMQDNATAVYTGSPAWTRGIGGDGCCTAINPFEDQIMIGSAQYGYLRLSGNGGQSWDQDLPGAPGTEAAFVAPFEYAPSDPNYLYLGQSVLARYDFGLGIWESLTPEGNLIITLGVSMTDPFDVFYSTAPGDNQPAGVYRANTISGEVQQITGLPDRMFTDIARHPADNETVYAVCSGFGSNHVWKSANGGNTWTALDNGLPDVPANSILIDPLQTTHLYVANDIGVWFSENDGASWSFLSANGPQAMQAMHLSISADRQLRVATHGLGVWQTPMVFEPVNVPEIAGLALDFQIFPNPSTEYLSVLYKGQKDISPIFTIYDNNGRMMSACKKMTLSPGVPATIQTGSLPAGTYTIGIDFQGRRVSKIIKVN